jgi:hypothetical protein
LPAHEKHAPDSEPGKRGTGRWLVYGTELPSIPEVGAVCGKAARTDLGGGREVTRVPTAKRLDFAKDFRYRQAKFGLSIKDDFEWSENEAAARWLRRHTNCSSQPGRHRISGRKPAEYGTKLSARKPLNLDPCDPHDQVAGVDMKTPPWK